ncbi:MAG: class I SAM-dependent methyltransferase [Candidatus Omnitrophota bacterium]
MEYIPKVTEAEREEVHRHYEERLALYRNRGLDFDEYRKFMLDKIAPLESDILELGTGTGYTAVFLAKKGYKFISIDTDEQALKTTAARLDYDKVLSNVKFHIMDATCLEFANDSFKSIIAVNVLHHVAEPEKFLLEADRVLYPKGKIIISDFNEEGLQIIDTVHREEGRSHDHPIADQDQICLFFEKQGYKINRFENRGHWIMIAQKR